MPAIEEELARDILDRVRALAAERQKRPSEFIPGITRIPYAGRVYGEEEMVNLVDSALEFWLTAGRYTAQFERELARSYGLRDAALVNSGSSANLLAFMALTSHVWGDRRIKPGDEVITVAAGFPTTLTPVLQYGAVPVFVDVALPTYNVDVSKLESAHSARTKAVMIAHTLGNPFDLDAVTAFCDRHGLWLIEDNCDANGSLYRSRRTGTFGDISTLSFYPPHHMTTGEGGAVLCKTPRMASIVRSYRDWGRDCWCDPGKDNTCGKRFAWQLGELPLGYDHKYVYSHLGYNLKATDLQAAIGLAQLGKIEAFGAARRANWGYYRQALDGLIEHFVLPEATTGADASWFGFLLCVRESAPFTRRDVVCELESKNIQTRMLFAGNLVRQPALTTLVQQCRDEGRPMPYRVVGGLAETDKVMEQAFWIGVYPGLTEAMREFVVATVKSFAARVRR